MEAPTLWECLELCWAMAAIHDQPSNMFFWWTKAKKATQKQKKVQNKRNLLSFCMCFAFFLVPLLHLWELLPVSNICCTLLEKKREKCENKAKTFEHKAKKTVNKATNTHSYIFLLLFALPFAFWGFIKLFWLLVSMAGAPDISLEVFNLQNELAVEKY